MNPMQQKLSAEIADLNARLDSLISVDCEDSERETRMKNIEEAQATLEKRQAALAFENKIAASRASAPEVRRQETALAIPGSKPAQQIVKREAPRGLKLRGFRDAEEAYAAGSYLRSLATGEPMNYRGAFTTASEAAKSMGENPVVYAGFGAELVPHDAIWGGILGLLSYDSLMVRYGMNLGQFAGDAITIPRSDDDIDADYIAENTEVPVVRIGTGGAKAYINGIKSRVQVSNELIEDAQDAGVMTVAQLVAAKFARAFNLRLDKTWLSGSPAAKANVDGLLTKADGTTSNLPAGHEITTAAVGKVSIDDLVAVMGAVDPNARNTVWLVSPKGWGQVMSSAKAIVGANFHDGVRLELFGSPVVKCEALPATHLAVYGDFSQSTQYAFKKNALEIAASRDRAIEYWQTVFVGCLRVAVANTGMKYVAALKAKV